MNSILRAGLGALLGLTLTFGAALAIEYDDIFEMTADGASDERIVREIVEDGRGFELSSREIDDLRDAGVSEIVIDAMRDPETGRRWLEEGDYGYDDDAYDDDRAYSGGGGYSTSLDDAYAQGYADGRTSLVYSFGYYYGPLARYYYDDPFYYSFWWSGHSYSYWPSYYAYWYRPAYAWSYAYPYNYYTYDSYYCYTYYDPGYWVASGYTVLPGYGRTIWDDGPRWRDGGLAPIKGGRPVGIADISPRLRDGTYARNPSSPPVIREALAGRTDTGRGGTVATRTPTERRTPGVGTPSARKPVGRATETRVGRGQARGSERGTVARGNAPGVRSGMRDVSRGKVVRSQSTRGESEERAGRAVPNVGRGEATRRSIERSQGRERSAERIARRPAESPAPERARVIRGNRLDRGEAVNRGRSAERRVSAAEPRRVEARERARTVDRGQARRPAREFRESRAPRQPEVRESRGYGRSEARVQNRREAPAPRARAERREAPPQVREERREARPQVREERREAPQARVREDRGGGGEAKAERAERGERGRGRGGR